MPADSEAPSGGWRSVYASMAVSTSAEAPAERSVPGLLPRGQIPTPDTGG